MKKRYRKKRYYRKRYQNNSDPQVFLWVLGSFGLVLFFYILEQIGVLEFIKTNKGLIFVLLILAGIVFTLYKLGIFKKRYRANNSFVPYKLEELYRMDPFLFEEYVAESFRQLGYTAHTTESQGDHGIDIWLRKGNRKIAVQVKRYHSKNYVGEPEIRDFVGSYAHYRDIEGIFLTTGEFTKQAYAWSKNKRGLRLMTGKQYENEILDRIMF